MANNDCLAEIDKIIHISTSISTKQNDSCGISNFDNKSNDDTKNTQRVSNENTVLNIFGEECFSEAASCDMASKDNYASFEKLIDEPVCPESSSRKSANLENSRDKSTSPFRPTNKSDSPERLSDISGSSDESSYKSVSTSSSIDISDTTEFSSDISVSSDIFDISDISSDKSAGQDISRDKSAGQDISRDKSAGQDISRDKSVFQDISSDKSVSQDISSDKSVSHYISSDKSVSQDISSDKSVSQDISSDKSVSQDISSDKSVSQDISSDKSVSQDILSGNYASQGILSGKYASQDISSEKSVSQEILSGNYASQGILSGNYASQGISSEKSASPHRLSNISDDSSSSNISDSSDLSSNISGIRSDKSDNFERSNDNTGYSEDIPIVPDKLGDKYLIDKSDKNDDRQKIPHGIPETFEIPEMSSFNSDSTDMTIKETNHPDCVRDIPVWLRNPLIDKSTIKLHKNSARARAVEICVERMLDKSQIISSSKSFIANYGENLRIKSYNSNQDSKKVLTVNGEKCEIFKCNPSNIGILKCSKENTLPNYKVVFLDRDEKHKEVDINKTNHELDASRVGIECIKSNTEYRTNNNTENIQSNDQVVHFIEPYPQIGISSGTSSIVTGYEKVDFIQDGTAIQNNVNSIKDILSIEIHLDNEKDKLFIKEETSDNEIARVGETNSQYDGDIKEICILENQLLNMDSNADNQVCTNSKTVIENKVTGSQVEDIEEYQNLTETDNGSQRLNMDSNKENRVCPYSKTVIGNRIFGSHVEDIMDVTEFGSDWITENILESSNVSFNSLDVLKSFRELCDSLLETFQSYVNSIINKAKLKISPSDSKMCAIAQTESKTDDVMVTDSIDDKDSTNDDDDDIEDDDDSMSQITNFWTLFQHLTAAAGTDVTAEQVEEDINTQVVLDIYNGFHELRTVDYGNLDLMEKYIRGCISSLQNTMLKSNDIIKRSSKLLRVEARSFGEMQELNHELNELAADTEYYMHDIDRALTGLKDFTDDYLYYKGCISQELGEFLVEDFPEIFK